MKYSFPSLWLGKERVFLIDERMGFFISLIVFLMTTLLFVLPSAFSSPSVTCLLRFFTLYMFTSASKDLSCFSLSNPADDVSLFSSKCLGV